MNDQSETPLYGEDRQVSGSNDPASDPVAKDNEFSPDFKPETDADIDTPGG